MQLCFLFDRAFLLDCTLLLRILPHAFSSKVDWWYHVCTVKYFQSSIEQRLYALIQNLWTDTFFECATLILAFPINTGPHPQSSPRNLPPPSDALCILSLEITFSTTHSTGDNYFIIAAHGNVTDVQDPYDIVENVPTGRGRRITVRRSTSTWLQAPIQVLNNLRKMLDLWALAELGRSVTLRRVHVWIGGRNPVLKADSLDLSGDVKSKLQVPGDLMLTDGINVSLFVESSRSDNDFDRRVIVHGFDSQLETETSNTYGPPSKMQSRRLKPN